MVHLLYDNSHMELKTSVVAQKEKIAHGLQQCHVTTQFPLQVISACFCADLFFLSAAPLCFRILNTDSNSNRNMFGNVRLFLLNLPALFPFQTAQSGAQKQMKTYLSSCLIFRTKVKRLKKQVVGFLMSRMMQNSFSQFFLSILISSLSLNSPDMR